MCLAIPGKLTEIVHDEPLMRIGRVTFGGIVKEINLAYVPEAALGDYVLVHVGFAIGIVNPSEAARVFEYLKQIGETEELRQDSKDGT